MKARKSFWTTIAALASVVIFALNVANGQNSLPKHATLEQKAEFAKKNLMIGLHSENAGLLESSIKLIAIIKIRVPSVDLTELQGELEKLSVTHPSATVRYKAYLAASVCSDCEWFAQDNSLVTTDDDQFFIGVAQRLQQKLFGFSSL